MLFTRRAITTELSPPIHAQTIVVKIGLPAALQERAECLHTELPDPAGRLNQCADGGYRDYPSGLRYGFSVNQADKKKLKQPDQFLTTTEHGIEWANQNRQSAIIAGVVVVVLILAIVGGFSLYQHRTAAAATAFGDAMQTYQTPVQNPNQPTPPGIKTFSSDKERAAAANKQFATVADQYGMTAPGKMASYFVGLTYMEEGQNQSAEDALKKTAGSWNNDLAALGKMALAQLYQQTGRDSQAATLYDELAKSNASTVPMGVAKLQLAAMYEGEGKPDEARKIYAELKDKDKDSKGQPGPAAEIAGEKLNPHPAGPGLGLQ